jgi:hypothetical protein
MKKQTFYTILLTALFLSIGGFVWYFRQTPLINFSTQSAPSVTQSVATTTSTETTKTKTPVITAVSKPSWVKKEMHLIEAKTSNINQAALKESLIAYQHARQMGLDSKQLLTVIDYSKPSYEKRLWVFNMKTGQPLFNTWVAHGKNSGGVKATSFSNQPGSLKSSLGVFVTAEPYVGGDGYSLRIKGLEHGFNSNAYNRDVVIHGARYVNSATIRARGDVGRSWGCPAVSKKLSTALINTIKGNTVIVAYYPDKNWLTHSKFLMT